MPPPTTTSLYTTPNLVFASGIIAWIIFIIALVFMKHEKYKHRESDYDKQERPQFKITKDMCNEQIRKLKILENKNTTMKKNMNDILKDSEYVMEEVKKLKTFMSEENRKTGGYSNNKSMRQLLDTELLLSALVNKIKEDAGPRNTLDPMDGLISDVDQLIIELKIIKEILATENDKAGKFNVQLLVVEAELATVSSKLKTNNMSSEDFDKIFIELKILQAALKILVTEYFNAGNSTMSGRLLAVDGLLSSVIIELKKVGRIKLNAMGFPEQGSAEYYTSSTVAQKAQARRDVQKMVVGSNGETYKNMY